MLPIAGREFPSSHEELRSALSNGLTSFNIHPHQVRVEGGTFPSVQLFEIDLSGARVGRDLKISSVSSSSGPELNADQFTLRAQPIQVEGFPVQIQLDANQAGFRFVRESEERIVLNLQKAATGSVSVEARQSDLEAAIMKFAGEAAARQGADIKSAQLKLEARGPRSLFVRGEVTAKAFIMSAKISLTGQIDVDDQFQLRFSNLTCTGEGMAGKLATGFLQPRLTELEQKTIPLLSFALGEIRLRDVHIEAGDTLKLKAAFGG